MSRQKFKRKGSRVQGDACGTDLSHVSQLIQLLLEALAHALMLVQLLLEGIKVLKLAHQLLLQVISAQL